MLTAFDIHLEYGARVLFQGVGFTIRAGDRVALVGSNGSGKTTLLRILAGQEHAHTGTVETPGGFRTGYLPQDGIEPESGTLLDECHRAFPEILQLHSELHRQEEALAQTPTGSAHETILHRITEIEEQLHLRDAQRLEGRIQRVLQGLGFSPSDLHRPSREFSGGWRMRIALARLLAAEPDLLILDEPTNHLDIDSQEWLEELLAAYPGSVLTVSHDRGFLDRVTNRTFHLHRGRLDNYEGNYSFFETEAVERREQRERSAAKQAREIAKVERFIERFRAKNTKATQVQSRIKALEKIERLDGGDSAEGQISIQFPEPPRGPQRLVELESVSQRYGDLEVFRDVTFRIERGEKLALVGRNGRGKSTLARLIAGVEPPSAGERIVRDGTRISWFAQHQAEELDPALTVEASAAAAAGSTDRLRVRGLLGAFLFSGDDVHKKVGVLSGGEKNRLALVRMLLRPANLLVLDEPTNHLDLASKTRLQAALTEFAGAVLIVAHDRDFLDPVISRVFAFEPDGFHDFPGNLSEYLWHREQSASTAAAAPAVPGAQPGRRETPRPAESPRDRRRREAEERSRLAPLRNRILLCEEEIEGLEQSIRRAEETMADAAFFDGSDRMASDLAAYESAKRKLLRTMEEWEKLSAEMEGTP